MRHGGEGDQRFEIGTLCVGEESRSTHKVFQNSLRVVMNKSGRLANRSDRVCDKDEKKRACRVLLRQPIRLGDYLRVRDILEKNDFVDE